MSPFFFKKKTIRSSQNGCRADSRTPSFLALCPILSGFLAQPPPQGASKTKAAERKMTCVTKTRLACFFVGVSENHDETNDFPEEPIGMSSSYCSFGQSKIIFLVIGFDRAQTL